MNSENCANNDSRFIRFIKGQLNLAMNNSKQAVEDALLDSPIGKRSALAHIIKAISYMDSAKAVYISNLPSLENGDVTNIIELFYCFAYDFLDQYAVYGLHNYNREIFKRYKQEYEESFLSL